MKEPLWKQLRDAAPVHPNYLLEEMEFNDRYPVDVYGLAEALDIQVIEVEDRADGCLIIEKDPPSAKIHVSSYVAKVRRRFTIAHEIGHLALGHHFEHTINRDVSPDRPWRVEREANQYAAQLLMPEKQTRLAFNAFETIEEMAEHFDVSLEALIYRLKDLRLING